jgi:hypothetical protein
MNTLIGSTVNQSFGQVRTLSPHVEELLLMNLNLMLRSKTVQPINKKIADFGGIVSEAVASLRASPHSISPPIPLTAKLRCGGSTPEV